MLNTSVYVLCARLSTGRNSSLLMGNLCSGHGRPARSKPTALPSGKFYYDWVPNYSHDTFCGSHTFETVPSHWQRNYQYPRYCRKRQSKPDYRKLEKPQWTERILCKTAGLPYFNYVKALSVVIRYATFRGG